MKKIRGKRFDVVRLLGESDDVGAAVDQLVAHEGRDSVVALLKRALADPDAWSSEDSPIVVADALAWLRELPFLVGALKEAAALVDVSAYAVEDDVVVDACVTALGSAGARALDVVLAAVDDGPARLSLIEVLAALGEAGAKDERAWALIAGLFGEGDVLAAVLFAHAYGDARCVPLVQRAVDDSNDPDVVRAAVDALDTFGAVRDSDRAKLAEVAAVEGDDVT